MNEGWSDVMSVAVAAMVVKYNTYEQKNGKRTSEQANEKRMWITVGIRQLVHVWHKRIVDTQNKRAVNVRPSSNRETTM